MANCGIVLSVKWNGQVIYKTTVMTNERTDHDNISVEIEELK